ncbi:MAG: S4 domain-containing protein, partial [Deltaproteobacteria bacterium]|nr:S4 domain-containing protein [Deltaproteobacteria bacterium]
MQTDTSDHETLKQLVEPTQAGARLDQFLAQVLGWSRARLQKLLKAGLVTVNGAPKAASHKVRTG